MAALVPSLLVLVFTALALAHPGTGLTGGRTGDGLVPLRSSVVELNSLTGPTVGNTSILAGEITHRRDPLDNFKFYNDGWNISNKHYWASVGYTAVTLFSIDVLWFVVFGLALTIIWCRHCCCPRVIYTYSRCAYALSLIMLILFTCASIIGAIVLYSGQGKFHSSTSSTLEYVIDQAGFTVDSLRNFSDNLAAAKKINVQREFLHDDVNNHIDDIVKKINTSANELNTRALNNSHNIQRVLNSIQLALIVIAAAMLLLAFLGFLFSLIGVKFLVYVLVIIGWILVAGTFIWCGIFLLFHNVVTDSCVSMGQWVANPQAHTALDDILPCVDAATANESLYQSKNVTFQLVNFVNTIIGTMSNQNFPPPIVSPYFNPLYFNQSGAQVPMFCNPYNPDLSDSSCVDGEVGFDNATEVWKGYVCDVKVESGNDVCTTVGRITPKMLEQMSAAITMGFGLYHYGPFLVELQDCTFVRQTFSYISYNNCPGLRLYSRWVYIGLVMVSIAVMMSLVFWIVYSKERRHRIYGKQFLVRPEVSPLQGKAH